MSSELAIVARELGKRYEIYRAPADRLKQMILPRLRGLVGAPPKAYFEEFWALRGVSFELRPGETVGIIGRNGSGKSTLLQLLCGTLHPSVGEVRSFGRIAALLELGAGFNPEFTGRENVFLSGLLYGIPEDELRRRFASIEKFADIGDFINQPVKTYSSGMYVRLAFAIAAHVDADTLVIDEALSVGDVRFTQKCMRFLRDFQQRGTLLFVSHDTTAVVNLCSRAIWLERGSMVMDGPARDVVEQYLAEQHAADRASLGEKVGVRVESARHSGSDGLPLDVVDPRQSDLNAVPGRNRVEVFHFDPETIKSEFGTGTARIVDVRFLDTDGNALQLIMGGEAVSLTMEAELLEPIDSPIFGFYVKDRLGQRLFGDNTYVTYSSKPVSANSGSRLRASFTFRMPVLPNGDYSIDVALASGSQDDHTQHHWIHDALAFKASESTMRFGLVGIPMHEIAIETVEGSP